LEKTESLINSIKYVTDSKYRDELKKKFEKSLKYHIEVKNDNNGFNYVGKVTL